MCYNISSNRIKTEHRKAVKLAEEVVSWAKGLI
jgi:hypothetical protein